ncbi:MAG: hypothetical protein AAGM22_14155 [Acidobacteriota bacterium]
MLCRPHNMPRSLARPLFRPRLSPPPAPPRWTAIAGLFAAALLISAGGESHAEPYVAPPPAPSAAETPWQWIAVRSTSTTTCPQAAPPPPTPGDPFPAPVWQESALFPGAGGALERFCRYRFTGTGGATAHVGQLFALLSGGLEALAPDRIAVHGLASLGDVLSQSLAKRFDRQVGRIDLPVDPTAPALRLAILDTSPTSGMNPSQLPENSHHGHTLQRFAEHLLCTSGPQSCAADITSRLALGYKSFTGDQLGPHDRDVVQGGFYGTISELAAAIWLEVEAANQQGARLVLNLSVGWDPLYGGLETDIREMPLDVQAVYRALREAACSNALVIAAAGNRTDQHGPQYGPLLPAAWAERPGPSAGSCSGVASAPANQLLYAVGGVQGTGAPLANARPDSAGRLAAYADHATLHSGDSPVTELPLTGSSVAALVASATAAAVLHYRPTWTVDEVMDNLYDSGDALGRFAERCQSPPCGAVRYLSLCEAVRRACHVNAPGSCPSALPPCPARPLDRAVVSAAIAPFALTSGQWVDVTVFEPKPHQDACGLHQPFAKPGFLPPEPSPHRQRGGLGRQPWAHPQPSSDPCPNCTLFPDSGEMALEIDSTFSGTVANATLVTCPDGVAPVAYSFGSLQLNAGDQVWVQGLQTPPCNSAFLSFTVTTNSSTSSALTPVLIAQP